MLSQAAECDAIGKQKLAWKTSIPTLPLRHWPRRIGATPAIHLQDRSSRREATMTRYVLTITPLLVVIGLGMTSFRSQSGPGELALGQESVPSRAATTGPGRLRPSFINDLQRNSDKLSLLIEWRADKKTKGVSLVLQTPGAIEQEAHEDDLRAVEIEVQTASRLIDELHRDGFLSDALATDGLTRTPRRPYCLVRLMVANQSFATFELLDRKFLDRLYAIRRAIGDDQGVAAAVVGIESLTLREIERLYYD